MRFCGRLTHLGFGLRRSRKLIIAASALIMVVLVVVVTLIVLRHNGQKSVQWALSSSKKIDTKARNFFHNGQIDSAVYYFTILSTRFSHDQVKPADVALSCHANTSLATIYTNFFYDYPKAENYLMCADSIARCNNLQEELANIYLAQANLSYDEKNIDGNFYYQPDVMHMFTKAFYQAQRVKNIYYENVAFVNIMYIALKYDRVGEIAYELPHYRRDLHAYVSRIDESLNYAHGNVPDSIVLVDYMSTLANGLSCYLVHDYASALHCFEQLPSFIVATNANTRSRYAFIASVARYRALVALKRQQDAASALDAIYSSVRNDTIKSLELEALNLLYCHYNTLDPVKANGYKLRFYEIKDEYTKKTQLAHVNEVKLMKLLDDARLKSSQEQHRIMVAQCLLSVLLLVTLALLAALFFLNQRYRKLKLRNYRLYRKINQELRPDSRQSVKYGGNALGEEKKSQIMHRIFMIMETSDEIYSSDFNMSRLGQLVDATANEVSQVINDRYKKNFNAMLAEYRIKEACRRFNEPRKYGQLTVEGVAASVGIKSRSHFSKLFKQVTGLTPTAYVKIARQTS